MLSLSSPDSSESPPSCALSWYKRRIRAYRCCMIGVREYGQLGLVQAIGWVKVAVFGVTGDVFSHLRYLSEQMWPHVCRCNRDCWFESISGVDVFVRWQRSLWVWRQRRVYAGWFNSVFLHKLACLSESVKCLVTWAAITIHLQNTHTHTLYAWLQYWCT